MNLAGKLARMEGENILTAFTAPITLNPLFAGLVPPGSTLGSHWR